MSGKKTKADLSALFKLEFYRKQSNWKFCSQVHQKDKKAPSKHKTKTTTTQHVDQSDKKCLNKTYQVKATENDERSELNNAFVETDNDKNISSTQNSPVATDKNWSLECVKTSDNWAPKDSQTEIPSQENSSLSHPENDLPELDLNLPEQCQNWPEKLDYNNYDQNCAEEEGRDHNWPCLTPENWQRDGNEVQTLPYDKMHQEAEFDPNWLQQQMKNCRQNWFNRKADYFYQNNPQNIKNCNQSKVMQSWENIALSQSNEKYQEINNNTPSRDWPQAEPLPDNIFENWHQWKETQISPNILQNWPEKVWQDDMIWQECQCIDLPEMDKDGYEGTEAGWPQETQIWTNHKQFPDAVWSEDVLRELEVLNAQELAPDIPEACEKWVPPDRLLQWMLTNKECCDDVLETSCESEDQFMRAAHAAPHSSEIDIKPQVAELETSELECGELLTGAVGALSEGALLAAGRAHARALRRVARELRNREQPPHSPANPATTAAQYDESCEEYPTRDIGLYQPSFIDTFVTGSYKNNPNNKLLDKPQENGLDLNANYNQYCSEAGRIVVDRVDRQIKVNRGSGLDKDQIGINMGQTGVNVGQTGINVGQTGINMGQTGINMGQTGINIGQTGVNMRQTGENMVQAGLVRDQMELDYLRINRYQIDSCQLGLRGQPSSFGDYNIIGRGRGRLPVMENQIGMGRGRGRNLDKNIFALN